MTHSFPDFTTHMLDLLKNTGPSGPTGPTPIKPFISKEKSGTSRATEVGPVDLDWSHHSAASGPAKTRRYNHLTRWDHWDQWDQYFAEGNEQSERGAHPQNGMRYLQS